MRTLCMLMLVGLSTGCQTITHELQPHRLWRWNYYEPTSRDAFGTFSIDDPLVESASPAMKSSQARSAHTESSEAAPVVAPMPTIKNHE